MNLLNRLVGPVKLTDELDAKSTEIESYLGTVAVELGTMKSQFRQGKWYLRSLSRNWMCVPRLPDFRITASTAEYNGKTLLRADIRGNWNYAFYSIMIVVISPTSMFVPFIEPAWRVLNAIAILSCAALVNWQYRRYRQRGLDEYRRLVKQLEKLVEEFISV